MPQIPVRIDDLRGMQRLAHDVVLGITDVVEAMHDAISVTGMLRARRDGRTRGITGLVYRAVRGVTRLSGRSADMLLRTAGRYVEDERASSRPPSPRRDALLAALNGLCGDYLSNTENSLAIPMTLRSGGAAIHCTKAALARAFPAPAPRLLVLVHGLCMNDLQWLRRGHDHGAALANDLGYTPLYLRYNTGRHISHNGRDFADAMQLLFREWPHRIERLSILGHSMGGLVIRSACYHASLAGHSWHRSLDRIVFLGTPHLGAPLERAGTLADLLLQISPYTAPFARLGMARSAGIKDLGNGHVRDEDSRAKPHGNRSAEPLRLPAGPTCYAIAASGQPRPSRSGRTRGDGLVPVASALGRSADGSDDIGFASAHCSIAYAMRHFDLLDRRDVYERIRDHLA